MTSLHLLPQAGLLRLLTLLVPLLLLTACGADAGPAEQDPPADDAPAPDDQAAPDDEAAPDDAPAQEADAEGPVTVYAGRSLELVGPVLERFTEETGIDLEVRDGDTAELAATILEERANSPADVYFAQDAGALGALSREGLLAPLPEELLDRVEDRFTAGDGTWVGVSGRARTIVYSTELVAEDEVPDSVLDLADQRWSGRVGWAPTNGSFQAFVTAMRVELGDDATRQWLEDMVANDARPYDDNTLIVEAAGRGEIEVGLVNHYYLARFTEEDPDFPAENKFLLTGDVGGLVNVAGVGVLATTDQPEASEALVNFLLSEEAQRYFSDETSEYPLVAGVEASPELPPLEDIQTPDLDLSDLEDLEGTLELLRETGAFD